MDKRARSWGGKGVGADTEVMCWQLDNDLLGGFIGGLNL
jgi:hypothetical protein